MRHLFITRGGKIEVTETSLSTANDFCASICRKCVFDLIFPNVFIVTYVQVSIFLKISLKVQSKICSHVENVIVSLQFKRRLNVLDA